MALEEEKIRNFKPLIFVSGKGGAGKSTVSLGICKSLKRQGKSVLYAHLGESKSVGLMLTQALSSEPVPCSYGFDVVQWTGHSCLREYVEHKLKFKGLSQAFFSNKFVENFLPLAPGLSEISILGKATSGIRNEGPSLGYDHVVIDGFSTGHLVAMLKTPKALADSVTVGPMHSQAKEIHRVLSNESHCSYILVSLLEPYSVDETQSAHIELKNITGLSAEVIANKKYVFDDVFLEQNPSAVRVCFAQEKMQETLVSELNLALAVPFIFKQGAILISSLDDGWLCPVK